MKTYAFTLMLLSTAGALAGCAAPNASDGTDSSDPADDVVPAVDGNATNHDGLRELAVDSWGEEFLTPLGPPHCDPASQWVCDVYAGGFGNVTGTFNGTGPLLARHHWDSSTNSAWVSRTFWFTGSVADCGSGSLTMYLEGHLAPDAKGGARMTGTVIILPGSTTSGLAGLVDYEGIIDQPAEIAFTHQPFAHLTGTMWCR